MRPNCGLARKIITRSTRTHWRSAPAVRGGSLALLAATLFGVSTPLVQRFGVGLGAFSTAALLYAGAALVGALLRQPVEFEARLRRTDAGRLVVMAVFGAVIGPVVAGAIYDRTQSYVYLLWGLVGVLLIVSCLYAMVVKPSPALHSETAPA